MIPNKPESFKWFKPGVKLEERWDYREIQEYPSPDAPEKEILAFIKDAKEAEEAIQEDLVAEGMPAKEAKVEACQWPLRDDAPMEMILDFIGYQYELQEAEKKGMDL